MKNLKNLNSLNSLNSMNSMNGLSKQRGEVVLTIIGMIVLAYSIMFVPYIIN